MSAGILTAQFSTDNDPDSATIRYLTMGTVSHVDRVMPAGIVLPDGTITKGGELLGARLKGGVMVRPPNYKTFTVKNILCMEIPDIDAANAWAMGTIGEPYDTGAIIDMVFHRTRSFNLNQKEWFCDCWLYAFGLKGGQAMLNTDNPLSLSPEEVMLSPYWKACTP
jgi:hypothetical protein